MVNQVAYASSFYRLQNILELHQSWSNIFGTAKNNLDLQKYKALECLTTVIHYLENKVGVHSRFCKRLRIGNVLKPKGLPGPASFETLPVLGLLQNLLLPLYFRGNVSLFTKSNKTEFININKRLCSLKKMTVYTTDKTQFTRFKTLFTNDKQLDI